MALDRKRLSICIATYKRARYIAETLRSVLEQAERGVEVVVVDGASPDDTADIVGAFARDFPQLRYFREDVNSGVDADYDKAVRYAVGDYCWLMTDDDLLVPGAVRAVLNALCDDPQLLLLNTEVFDATLTNPLESPRFRAETDLEFESSANEDFFRRFAQYLTFIGAVVIQRSMWLARERSSYLGSMFVHVGVIFQTPGLERIRFLSKPLVKIRYGNAMWSVRGFDVWTYKWPELVWSFPAYSWAAKQAVCARQPWRKARHLLLHRALGTFDAEQFRSISRRGAPLKDRVLPLLLLLCPKALANLLAVTLLTLLRPDAKVGLYDLLRSPHASVASRLAARLPSLAGKNP